jgi:hypothetical protein
VDPLIQLVLAATIGVLAVSGGIITALRLIPRPPVTDDVKTLRKELSDLQLQFLDFADRYELAVTRNNAKIGKLRAKLARATSDDLEEEEEYPDEPVPTPAPVAVAPTTKAALWNDFNRQKGAT